MTEHKLEQVDPAFVAQGMPKNPSPGTREKEYANFLGGPSVETHFDVSVADIAQRAAEWHSFIEGRRTALYLKGAQGGISEEAYRQEAGDLNRIRDRGIIGIAEWSAGTEPKTTDFDALVRLRFNALVEDLDSPIPEREVPQGPVNANTPVETADDLPIAEVQSDPFAGSLVIDDEGNAVELNSIIETEETSEEEAEVEESSEAEDAS